MILLILYFIGYILAAWIYIKVLCLDEQKYITIMNIAYAMLLGFCSWIFVIVFIFSVYGDKIIFDKRKKL
jgi:amino acid transporter